MTQSRLHQLSALGQSVWIDTLSREMLRSGKLARLMDEDAVVGVTSNPTIFQKALAEGDAYDDQLRRELQDERDPTRSADRSAARLEGKAHNAPLPATYDLDARGGGRSRGSA